MMMNGAANTSSGTAATRACHRPNFEQAEAWETNAENLVSACEQPGDGEAKGNCEQGLDDIRRNHRLLHGFVHSKSVSDFRTNLAERASRRHEFLKKG